MINGNALHPSSPLRLRALSARKRGPETASLRVSYRRSAQKSQRDAGNVNWVTRGTVGSAVILP
jgi:hypothetical protein